MAHPQRPYEKYISRDFALSLIQTWYRGETSVPKGWTDEMQPYLPYIVFERQGPTVISYYGPDGLEWVKALLCKRAEDRAFIEALVSHLKHDLDQICPVYEQGQTLQPAELVEYLRLTAGFWPWFEALWWLAVDADDPLTGELEEIRRRMNPLCVEIDALIYRSLEAVYPELGRLVGQLTIEEIESGTLPSRDELQQRTEHYVYTGDRLYVGHELEAIEREYGISVNKESVAPNAGPLKGQIAQKGQASGKVKLIFTASEMGKVEEGDIIVAPMTMPDILPAMRKAAAFVTDEGGVMCHAAIIARELGKPCVTGTKVATAVFKDGDMVTVDADSGTVSPVNYATN